jgi:hypothetical protein
MIAIPRDKKVVGVNILFVRRLPVWQGKFWRHDSRCFSSLQEADVDPTG